MLSIFNTKKSRGGDFTAPERVHDIRQVYLVNSPMTDDWVESQTIHCDPKKGYLVFQNNQFIFCSKNHSIALDEKNLHPLFCKIKAGWSVKATLDELIIMTNACPKLNKELGDLVIMMKHGYDLADYPPPQRAQKIAEIRSNCESQTLWDSSYFKA